jgi:hypothetical protein
LLVVAEVVMTLPVVVVLVDFFIMVAKIQKLQTAIR